MMLEIRADQIRRLQVARREGLRRRLAKAIERHAADMPEVLPEAHAFASKLRLDAPENADATARSIVARCVERDRDPEFADALEHVLCQVRPLGDRLAFIERHVMPHRRLPTEPGTGPDTVL